MTPYSPVRILSAAILAAFGLGSTVALAATVDATFSSATDAPVTASRPFSGNLLHRNMFG